MRHRYLDKLESGQPVTIAVYGTSLSAEKCAFWRQTGGSWVSCLRKEIWRKTAGLVNLRNAAQWGSDSNWGVKKLGSRLLRHEPDIVLLEFAINDADIRRNLSLGRSRDNLLSMVRQIEDRNTRCDIVLLTMNPAFGRPLLYRPKLDYYYQIYHQVATECCLTLVDNYGHWKQLLAKEPELSRHLPDGIHPDTWAGQHIVLPRVLQALEIPTIEPRP